MQEQQKYNTMFDDSDLTHFDVIALEQQARRLRAKAMADAMRKTGQWVQARVASLRGVNQTA